MPSVTDLIAQGKIVYIFYKFLLLSWVWQCQATEIQNRTAISSILDRLLDGYDKRLRPGFGDEAVVVQTDLVLRSIGPVSELNMHYEPVMARRKSIAHLSFYTIYTLDCYFRQRWTDSRLSMNVSIENLTLGIKTLEGIWHPDTVFYNGQKSHLHAITSYNRFLRIGRNGSVLFSQRLTISATCKMHLENFPMDVQHCPLLIGSFAYSSQDVQYIWTFGQQKSVELAANLRLSQFDLVGYPLSSYTDNARGVAHSVLQVTFKLSRHTGYFIINLYLPCCLLVIISWVSFWINREATAERIALGATTALTLTLLEMENKNQLPKVSYITALDIYVVLCFVFVIATTLEFAVVHYFTKYGSGEPIVIHSDEEITEEEVSDDNEAETASTTDEGYTYGWPPQRIGVKIGAIAKLFLCLTGTRAKAHQHRMAKAELTNTVSQVDKVSRVLFPVTFGVTNLLYAVAYWLWAFSEHYNQH